LENQAAVPLSFLLVAAVFGLMFLVVLPPLQAPDEFGHFYRAFGISQGTFVARPFTPVPSTVRQLTQVFPVHLEEQRKLTPDAITARLDDPLQSSAIEGVRNEGTNLNFWLPYIPSAVAIRLGTLFEASPVSLLYLARTANLASFLLLTWQALRLIPSTGLLLLPVTLLPMVIHQGASVSWDSIAFGVAFLFSAVVMHHAYERADKPLTRSQLAMLAGLIVVVALSKINFCLLPLLALLPDAKFGGRRARLLCLFAAASIAFGSGMLWQAFNRENLLLFQTAVQRRGIDFPDNIRHYYYNAGYVINAIVRTAWFNGPIYLTNLAGTFGWMAVYLPVWAATACTTVMLGNAWLGGRAIALSLQARAILLAVVVLGVGSVLSAMWMAETPEPYIRETLLRDFGTLPGIQGRHFVPIAFPFLLLISWSRIRLRSVVLTMATAGVAAAACTAGLAAILRTYYVL
jgi:uncharacterized membrane protein